MKERHVMAFDLGASNGRAIIGEYKDGAISLHELHRFQNNPVRLGKHIYWDFPRLFHELLTSLVEAKNQGYNVESIGIDTWGVDYGLIDTDGNLMGNPIHYRDVRAAEGMEMLLSKYSAKDMKRKTGMDCVSFNTINQLINDSVIKHSSNVAAMLNTPDLFNYFLTGKMVSEYSIASTTQLYDYGQRDWDWSLIEALGLPRGIFREVVASGTIVGDIKEELLDEMKLKITKVVAVTSHDTATAVAAVPADEDDFLFISTGTWIVCGANKKEMTVNEHMMDFDLTNEGGRFPHVNLLKNHVGLWIIQEARRSWQKEGLDIGFGVMVEKAKSVDIDSFIDINDERFFEPGQMPEKIAAFCKETGQTVPIGVGETVKVIEQSLGREISRTLRKIETSVGKTYDKVYIFGGGVQDQLLCSLISEYSGKELVVGMKEGAAYGNVLDQLTALGIIEENQWKDIKRL